MSLNRLIYCRPATDTIGNNIENSGKVIPSNASVYMFMHIRNREDVSND